MPHMVLRRSTTPTHPPVQPFLSLFRSLLLLNATSSRLHSRSATQRTSASTVVALSSLVQGVRKSVSPLPQKHTRVCGGAMLEHQHLHPPPVKALPDAHNSLAACCQLSEVCAHCSPTRDAIAGCIHQRPPVQASDRSSLRLTIDGEAGAGE